MADELHEHQVGDFRNAHNDVAVTGHGGAANVYVVDASGYVHYSLANGEEGTWRHVRPGTGAELTGIDFCGERRGFAADDDGAVYATEDGEKWDASLVGTDVTLYSTVCRQPGETRPERQEEDEEGEDATDVESEPEVVETEVEDVWVSGDGKVCHYDGVQWRVDDHGSSSINDVDCDQTETLGVAGGGRVFDLEESGELTEEETPTGETLNGVAVGAFDVAVGASGVVIQKEN
ncbi:hypothetical protein [Halospeciosus flavus]|uniref:hypothetical protein n=1 Tax=Halospeciosus flavus TaxID=3032283 RepID=UPI00360AD560